MTDDHTFDYWQDKANAYMRLLDRYENALTRIAAGPRPDGTYNLSREACETLAKDALAEGLYEW